MTGDVVVEKGVTLTVAPGTVVLVSGGPDVDIIVEGSLFVRGEKGYPVVFDSADGCTLDEKWGGIVFLEGSRGALEAMEVRCSVKGVMGDMRDVTIDGMIP